MISALTKSARTLFGAGFLLASAGPALPLDLALPIDCVLGETCYIQQFFDHDAGPSFTDFTCGTLAYDGHDGTDFALPTRADMAAGTAVLAAAAGIVRGTRDGVADFTAHEAGRECGNGVVIDHGMGWQTQYCHLRNGSVQVATGQSVAVGAVLGMVGQSGMADFPHLHFGLRQNDVHLDPFAPNATNTCSVNAPANQSDLWQDDIAYAAGGIIGAGFSTEIPDFDAVKAGSAGANSLPRTAPALVLWVYMFGAQAGDAVLFDITGPNGKIITERSQLDRTQALVMRAVGRKLRGAGWDAGTYTGTARLMRGAQEIGRAAVTATITP